MDLLQVSGSSISSVREEVDGGASGRAQRCQVSRRILTAGVRGKSASIWMSNGNITEAGRTSAAHTPWDPPSGGSAVVSVLDPGTPWLVRSPTRGSEPAVTICETVTLLELTEVTVV